MLIMPQSEAIILLASGPLPEENRQRMRDSLLRMIGELVKSVHVFLLLALSLSLSVSLFPSYRCVRLDPHLTPLSLQAFPAEAG